ncbi:hypothetical protein [Paenibacillus sp. MMS20-IR301]|uniref:hypothetical protein n=1 Tax=Paenibacillus sp. MMS20-IR301 TaxID=2895946 RepID=UPI0028E2332D|nr:hypothetical protein [Paenibacillus sp. MMS20-IR301]WNS45469.1 hypothetical protein LOS79_09420 [Paenibacillus sp. MMS20-IR301]
MAIRGRWIGIIAVIMLLISGCVDKADYSSGREPVADTNAVTAGGGSPPADGPVEAAHLGNVRSFLNSLEKDNGDIYLGDSTLHVNIVGLDQATEAKFAERFTAGSYVLHDVKYPIQELQAAYDLLANQGQDSPLNLYSAELDVQNNCIGITVPQEAGPAVVNKLHDLIDPGMLKITVKELGSPEVTGEITAIEEEGLSRILIQEPERDIPTYWFTINTSSQLYDEAGNELAQDELHVGDTVRLWSTGLILESLPAQATVRRLELADRH